MGHVNLHVYLHMYFLNDALGLSGNLTQSTTDNQALVTTQQDSDGNLIYKNCIIKIYWCHSQCGE